MTDEGGLFNDGGVWGLNDDYTQFRRMQVRDSIREKEELDKKRREQLFAAAKVAAWIGSAPLRQAAEKAMKRDNDVYDAVEELENTPTVYYGSYSGRVSHEFPQLGEELRAAPARLQALFNAMGDASSSRARVYENGVVVVDSLYDPATVHGVELVMTYLRYKNVWYAKNVLQAFCDYAERVHRVVNLKEGANG